jgi:type I restriction enzyme, R subunit
LMGYTIHKNSAIDLGLTGEGELIPVTEAGTKTPVDPKLAHLREAVEQLNTLFDGDSFTEADFVGFYTHVKGKAAENEKIASQVKANSEKQFLASPDLKGSVITAMVSASDNFKGMTSEALDDDAKLAKLVELIGRALYRDGRDVA